MSIKYMELGLSQDNPNLTLSWHEVRIGNRIIEVNVKEHYLHFSPRRNQLYRVVWDQVAYAAYDLTPYIYAIHSALHGVLALETEYLRYRVDAVNLDDQYVRYSIERKAPAEYAGTNWSPPDVWAKQVKLHTITETWNPPTV